MAIAYGFDEDGTPSDAARAGIELVIAAWHAENPDNNELRGTGMPNGVVTANPGTYYTDTAGTNGAWRWLKKSGTGNTGWECIVGDTGWRNLSGVVSYQPGVAAGPDGDYTLSWRMVAPGVCTAYFCVETTAVFAGGHAFTLPAGFLEWSPPTFAPPTGYVGAQWWWLGDHVYFGGPGANPARRSGVFTYIPSSSSWPTSLPGTAI